MKKYWLCHWKSTRIRCGRRTLPDINEPFQLHRFKNCRNTAFRQRISYRLYTGWFCGKKTTDTSFELHSGQKVYQWHYPYQGYALHAPETARMWDQLWIIRDRIPESRPRRDTFSHIPDWYRWERELAFLKEFYDKDGIGMTVIYGRRRIGKSTLNRSCLWFYW